MYSYTLAVHVHTFTQVVTFWNNLDSQDWTEHGDHLIKIIEVCVYISCDFIFGVINEWLLQTVTNSAKNYANTAYEGLKSSGHSDGTSFVATELVCTYTYVANALISYIQHIIILE